MSRKSAIPGGRKYGKCHKLYVLTHLGMDEYFCATALRQFYGLEAQPLGSLTHLLGFQVSLV